MSSLKSETKIILLVKFKANEIINLNRFVKNTFLYLSLLSARYCSR